MTARCLVEGNVGLGRYRQFFFPREEDIEEKWKVRTDGFIDMMRRVRLGECGYVVGEAWRWDGNQ